MLLKDKILDLSTDVPDLNFGSGVLANQDVNWKIHVNQRLGLANRVLYLLRRNVVLSVTLEVKLGLFLSLILLVLL